MENSKRRFQVHGAIQHVPLAFYSDEGGLCMIPCDDTASRHRTSVVHVRQFDRKSMGGGDLR